MIEICFNVLNFGKCAGTLMGQTREPLNSHTPDLHRISPYTIVMHTNLCDAINMKASSPIFKV